MKHTDKDWLISCFVVTSSYSEPLVGWVDNLNGPTGLMVGAGKGVIRSMHCKAEYNAEVMPVDMTINAVIAITYKIVENPKKWVIPFSLSFNNWMALYKSEHIDSYIMLFSLFSISLFYIFLILFTFIVRQRTLICIMLDSKFTLCNIRDAVFEFSKFPNICILLLIPKILFLILLLSAFFY